MLRLGRTLLLVGYFAVCVFPFVVYHIVRGKDLP